VTTYRFQTNSSDEQDIATRIDRLGDPGGCYCAASVSSAIGGIGPFNDVRGGTFLPGTLEQQLRNIPGVGMTTAADAGANVGGQSLSDGGQGLLNVLGPSSASAASSINQK
jgi:hypothetical protein